MTTKNKIKTLLSKGDLTGMEAARLIIADSVEVDHGRPGFLTDSLIERLKSGLNSLPDIQEYNRWIRAYQLVDYTIKEGRIAALEAGRLLAIASSKLERYWLEDNIRHLAHILPAIVTQKQYEELKAKQRENELKELLPLSSFFDEVAHNVAPQAIKDNWMAAEDEDGVYGDLIDYLEEKEPELYRQAIQQGITLIQEGKIKPVHLLKETIQQLERLEAEEEEQRAKDRDQPEERLNSFNIWSDFCKRKKRILKAGYQAAKDSQDLEGLLRLLEQLKAGSLTDQERDDLLYRTYCQTEELYQQGLAKWLDEYRPNLDEETAARPKGMMQSGKVAIIQEPSQDDLDERGYYKDRGMEMLFGLSGIKRITERAKDGHPPIAEMIKKMHQAASENIKIFIAIQAVVGAISEIIGVKLDEDLDEMESQLQATIDYYNLLLEPRNEWYPAPHYLGMPKLASLKIGKLKATAKSLQYYRDRMAMALGDHDWWREAIRTLDFQTEEPDSLAGKLAEDIQALRKEEQNG